MIQGLIPGATYTVTEILAPNPDYTVAPPQTFTATSSTTTLSFVDKAIPSQACTICILDPVDSGSLKASGGSTVNWTGALTVDSVSASGVLATGQSTISGQSAFLAGGYKTTGTSVFSTTTPVQKGSATDPYAWYVFPTQSGTPTALTVTTSQTASPGIYTNIAVSGRATLTLNPGVYVVTGGVSITGGAQIFGSGVTIYVACPSYPSPCAKGQTGAGFTLTGGSSVNISGGAVGPGGGFVLLSDHNNVSSIAVMNGVFSASGNIDMANFGILTTTSHAAINLNGGVIVLYQAKASGGSTIAVDM